MRVGPHDQLALGTLVQVGNMVGNVVKVEIVPAHPSGMIVVHTIMFTDKVILKHIQGWDRKAVYKKTKLKKPTRKTVNYSSIFVL
jgi:hypothetical protein